ncbi:hypothetical protein A2272_05130 [Candidatus Peregrinibacteria bacterium RIFOXYA12_FULL_33_12]|nr:MAG: hypothetical protein A2272_05130 [Candidatus Peregrinibacteria bacterium RIFOXYA12_FULL_33_12]OGJ45516.1 MAG: hypothetical protein A2263_05955 [Candidatus Peregrinibacteria bacterium RIFOXYA2_FULL_33_21]
MESTKNNLNGFIIITMLISIAFVACTNITPTSIIFPTQDKPATEWMQALLSGKLLIDNDGCVRIGDSLIIWPYEFSLKNINGVYTVFDNLGKAVGNIGDQIKISGGEDSSYTDQKCQGPYWEAGNEINKVDPLIPLSINKI